MIKMKILAITVAASTLFCGCEKGVENSPNTDFSSISSSTSYVDAVTSLDNSSICERDADSTESYELPATVVPEKNEDSKTDSKREEVTIIIPEVSESITTTTTTKTETTESKTSKKEKDSLKNKIETAEAIIESGTEKDILVYKASTGYVHRGDCGWVTHECEVLGRVAATQAILRSSSL